MTEMESPSIEQSLSSSDEQENKGSQTRSSHIDVQQEVIDKSRDADQRTAWNKLKVAIGYLIYKVNPINIGTVRKELLQLNMIRGKHLFCQFIIQAHLSSTDTHVYATLVAAINLVLPEVGELVLKKCIMNFKIAYYSIDESTCFAFAMFIGHLINHSVADEKLAVEILQLVHEDLDNFTVEIAVTILEICGKKISEVHKDILNRLIDDLHDYCIDEQFDALENNPLKDRLKMMLELHENGFRFNQLDLVPTESQITHFSPLTPLDIEEDPINILDYHYDPEFELNEKMYKSLILKSQECDSEDESEFESVTDFNNQYNGEKKFIKIMKLINDMEKDNNVLSLRNICIRKAINFIDLKMNYKEFVQQILKHGLGMDLCFMMLDCCCEHTTYENNFGLLAKEFSETNKIFSDMMEITFIHSCVTSNCFDTHKTQNIAKLFAYLLHINVISYNLISILEDELLSPNKSFSTIVFEELDSF